MPAITAIIPTYNRAGTLGRAVRSALEQSLPCAQVIVVDDGSTDGTAGVLAEFGDRIRVIRKPNGGVSSARNAGVAAATTQWVAFLDSDDRWQPDKIQKQAPLLEKPGVVLAATDWRIDQPDAPTAFAKARLGDVARWGDPPLELLTRADGNALWLPTWIVRRDALLHVGGFDERMRCVEDTRLMFRLAFEGQFALCDTVGTIRSAEQDGLQLTVGRDLAYRRQMVPATLEVLLETYARAAEQPAVVRRQLRSLIAYYLVAHAKLLAVEGQSCAARGRAWCSLGYGLRRDLLPQVLALMLVPGLFGRRHARRMGYVAHSTAAPSLGVA